MKDIKLRSRVSDAAKPPAPPGLVSIEESIDDIARKALDAAQRAEEVETAKRDADKTPNNVSIKVAI